MKRWAKTVWNGLFAASPRPAAKVSSRRVRLHAEALEDRAVPARYIVNSLADVPAPATGVITLRKAVELANVNPGRDDVVFSPALLRKTINLDDSLGHINITDSVNITAWGAAYLKVDGGMDSDDLGGTRIFNVSGGEGINVAISGLTLQNGHAARGGAINVNSRISGPPASLTLRGVVFSNNHADERGGAVSIGDGTITTTIQDSVFAGNAAGNEGGGAFFSQSDGATLIQRSRFTDNYAGTTGGAADFLGAGSIRIERSVFSTNFAELSPGSDEERGGAVNVNDATSLLVSYSTFTDNFGNVGGAIAMYDVATARIEYSTIARNRGDVSGGGIWWGDDATGTHKLTIFASTINNNESTGNNFSEGIGEAGGIAIYAQKAGSEFFLLNSTIYGNTSNGNGGGVLIEGGTATLVNDTITRNTSQVGDGGGIFACDGAVVNLQNSIVDRNTGFIGEQESIIANDISSAGGFATWNVQFTLIQALPDNTINGINSNNIFGVSANLGALRYNGGPTQTAAFLGLSPAIQSGSVALARAQGLVWDQRGPGFYRLFAGRIDMGAFQSNIRRRW